MPKFEQISFLQDFPQQKRLLEAAAFVRTLKAAMNNVGDASPLSRAQILDKMNGICRLTGLRLTAGRKESISPDTLDKWLAVEDTAHVPGLLALHVFCLATNSNEPLVIWLSLLGKNAEIMSEEDKFYRDYGKALLEKEAAVSKVNMVKAQIKERRF